VSNEVLQALFEDAYKDDTFVDVMPFGSHPETRSTRASNMLRIALHRPANGNTVVVLVVQDNLVKGSSGQAVQCMNLMFGLDETTGLMHVPVMP
jgi:N-acetyl-gamma-glutamyl-phosphate reductase